ncbi:GLPGLI family protein [Pedobacter changchengzhani]|uniref:GLPGLI family protein n=1 Tax=Pedobacter changchengzhani TaxID=2529274 RepID=A0A4R5MJX7_9SPHI|nr:GLPGLI family protein [Pedobacter changchengzhani]TDG35930.1 GLPGLI family protein [Pedobacter changchengzhani]
MKYLNSIVLFLFSLTIAKAQTVFIKSAKITYEKKVNIKQELAENTWISDDAKDKMGTYRISNWDYYFIDSTSVYKAKPKEVPSGNDFFFGSGDNTSEIYTDFKKKSRILRKNINGDDYILKDTIPQLKWKIVNDTRKIIGYECRKATAVIDDTVTVVAFYTDEILVKGGPEGFTGLPGMILGLAIPRFNKTWFATKIEAKNAAVFTVEPPTKGKKTENEKDFNKMIESYTKYDDKKKPRKLETVKKEIYNLLL